jgi:hypothetical protein
LCSPILVRQATAGQPIYYSDLASEVGIPNPRNLNYILGEIGKAIELLNKSKDTDVPPIQCLVLNKNTNLPGEGFNGFLHIVDFRKLTRSRKRDVINQQLSVIYNYSKWEWVLEQFNLKPLIVNIDALLVRAANIGFGGGESEDHRAFKEAIAKRPSLIQLSLPVGEMEYKLPSGDILDILFNNGDMIIGIEVKSQISSKEDILRGIFQCVKYKAIVEAKQKAQGLIPNSRIFIILP